MRYKITCSSHTDGCSDCKDYDSYSEALSVYNKHFELGHDVSMVPLATLIDDEVEGFAPFRIGAPSKKVADIRINSKGKLKPFVMPEVIADADMPTPPPATPQPPPPPRKKSNNYVQKLVTLIPSEVLAVYLALYSVGKGSAKEYTAEDAGWLFWISVIGLLLVFISRIFGTKKTGYSSKSHFDTIQWGGVLIAAVSFVIWLYAMGHQFANIDIPEKRIIDGAVILWTFIIPYFYRGDK